MTDSEKIKEWIHTFQLLQSDEAKWQLFIHLKKQGDKVSREALEKMVGLWLQEK